MRSIASDETLERALPRAAQMIRSTSVILIVLGTLLAADAPTASAEEPPPTTRIAGGYYPPSDYGPWATFIRNSNGGFCSASLIGPDRVLTAAHCFDRGYPPSTWTAYVGTRDYSMGGGETHGVTGIAIHPQYTGSVGNYDSRFDVAILFLDAPSSIAVGEVGTETDWSEIGVTLGWGHYNYDHQNRLNDPRLKAVNLELGSDEICGEWLNYQYEVYVPSLHVCAWDDEGDDCVMHGDSGGPLVVNNKIIGVTAYSPPPINGGWGPCGKDAMQVYTWVAGPLLRTWLLTVPNPTPPAPPPPPVKDCGAQVRALRAAQRKAARQHRRVMRANRPSGKPRQRLRAAKRLVRVKKKALATCQASS